MAQASGSSARSRVRDVREQFREITGLEPVSVSGLARVEDGWELMVDVVELRRIPDTSSLIATYRVTTDEAGEIATYERVRRYSRGVAD